MAMTTQPTSGDVIDLTGTNSFAAGIFSCQGDCKACLYGQYCSLCMLLDIQKSTKEVFLCTNPVLLRQKIRHMRRIKGNGFMDEIMFCLFPSCAMCQMYHELKVANVLNPCCCGC